MSHYPDLADKVVLVTGAGSGIGVGIRGTSRDTDNPLLGRWDRQEQRQLQWLWQPLGLQADGSGEEFHPQRLRASRHAGQRLGVDVFAVQEELRWQRTRVCGFCQ